MMILQVLGPLAIVAGILWLFQWNPKFKK